MSKQSTSVKSCLVISYGPVPTSEYKTVEGGGMRAWGLAQGLASHGISVTVAVNASFPQKLSSYEGIQLTTWGKDQAFVDLLNSFDAVVASYCMGDDSEFIAKNIDNNVALVLDAYVPIYVEVSARDSDDIEREYRNYMHDIVRFNFTLRRGDYFLCAHETQKVFYTGVLSSLGIINPRSYRQDRILVTPFGIPSTPATAPHNPYKEYGVTNKDKVVLWFGGLYPWFRIEEYLEAMLRLTKTNPEAKFFIVGGKNPFNSAPDFVKQYEKTVAFAKKHNLYNKRIFFVDWVDYEKRAEWYKHAEFVISINQPGEENKFSWRTRVMDYIWGELVSITNGGDPLSEELLDARAAIRVDVLDAQHIADAIQHSLDNPAVITNAKKELKKLQQKYQWENVTEKLASSIDSGARPYIEEKLFAHNIGVHDHVPVERYSKLPRSVRRPLVLGNKALGYTRKHGVKKLVKTSMHKVKQRLPETPNKDRRYFFISHPINNTGAPLVMMSAVEEFIAAFGGAAIKVVAPHIEAHHLRTLRVAGAKVDRITPDSNLQDARLHLDFRHNDFVLLNTIAVKQEYIEIVISSLEKNSLKEAVWYIHEDISQLGPVGSWLSRPDFKKRVCDLIERGSLRVYVPSERVRKDYNEFFETDNVVTLPYNVSVPETYKKDRPASDYESLNFLLSGTATDGRKGQFIALSAFYTFLKEYYDKNPSNYRDFTLHLVAIGSDFISQQITTLGRSLLGDERLKIYSPMPRDKVLSITEACNVVICCSLNETFAIYVAEGMFMQHAVLRNGSAGMEEQLVEGKNGYYVDENDVRQFASRIEKLLNKKTKDSSLKAMGAYSQKLITPFEKNTYMKTLLGKDE